MSELWTKWQGYVVNGEYPLQRYLGGSDQSAVFLSEAAGRQPTEVAIKLVPAHPTFAELLLARWKAASDLPHPNLMQLLDGGQLELGGQPFAYVVMEYADQNLAELLERRALTEGEVREMVLPVLDALAYLHNRNLVQGQLKPSNVLVVGDQIRLASDTIRPVSDTFASTNIASVYDPPEVQDGSVSTASDIWALGVTLFESLTRTAPTGLENGRAGAALPAEFSATIREAVSWCLKRRPFDRPKVAELEAKVREAGEASASPGAASAEAAVVSSDAGQAQSAARGAESLKSAEPSQGAARPPSADSAKVAADAEQSVEIVVNPDSFAFVDTPASVERSPPLAPTPVSGTSTSGEVHAQFSAADEFGRVAPVPREVSPNRTPSTPAASSAGVVPVPRATSPAPARHASVASAASSAAPTSVSPSRPAAGAAPPTRIVPGAGVATSPGSTASTGTVPVLKVGSPVAGATVGARAAPTAAAAAPNAGSTSSTGTMPVMRAPPATAAAPDRSAPRARAAPVATGASAGAASGSEARSTSTTGTAPVMRVAPGVGSAPVAKTVPAGAGAPEAKSTSNTGTMSALRVPTAPGGAPAGVGAPEAKSISSTGTMPALRVPVAPRTGSTAPGVGPVARGATAAGAAAEASRLGRAGPAGGRAATVPPTAAVGSTTALHAPTASPAQQSRPTPLPPTDISARNAQEVPTRRAPGPQAAGTPAPPIAVISKTIELKKPNLAELQSDDAVTDFSDEELPRRPPYVLLLVAICVLIVGWVVVHGLGATPKQTAAAAPPVPSRPRPVESGPTTLVRDVPKPLVIATAPKPTPRQQSEPADSAPPRPATPTASDTSTAPVGSAGIHQEIPEVPARARRTIRGHVKVTVRLIVDNDGGVFAALVDHPGPSRYFEKVAIDAAKKWTFPAVAGADSRLELVQFDFTRQGTTGAAVAVQ